MNPGDTWVGNKRADYQYILEQDDPANPRTRDVTWQGRDCIAFWLYNEDRGPNANPPGDDTNPRTQAESSRFMERGGRYIIDHYTYMRRETFPTWSWRLVQPVGKVRIRCTPAPRHPSSYGSHDGEHLDFTMGEAPWDVNYRAPIQFDQWDQITFDFVNTDPGPLTVSHNGVPVFTNSAYPNINASDKDGPWCNVAHLYMERDGVVPDGVRIGPVWMYNVVRQVA